jgi:hypothetical protein
MMNADDSSDLPMILPAGGRGAAPQHHYDHDDDRQSSASAGPLQPRKQPHERNGSFLDTVVRAAASMNNVLLEHCNVCTVYCDKQVQYETTWEAATQMEASATLTHLFHRMNSYNTSGVQSGHDSNNSNENDDIQRYQDFLFDEQSVIESVSSRAEDTDE